MTQGLRETQTTQRALYRQMLEEPESDLAMAARRVAKGRQIVAQQRARIARLKARGIPTLDHEQALLLIEGTQQILEEHEQMLRKIAANS